MLKAFSKVVVRLVITAGVMALLLWSPWGERGASYIPKIAGLAFGVLTLLVGFFLDWYAARTLALALRDTFRNDFSAQNEFTHDPTLVNASNIWRLGSTLLVAGIGILLRFAAL